MPASCRISQIRRENIVLLQRLSNQFKFENSIIIKLIRLGRNGFAGINKSLTIFPGFIGGRRRRPKALFRS